MKKKKLDIDKLINSATIGTSRWELDNIVYHDRTSNPVTLLEDVVNEIKLVEKKNTVFRNFKNS